MIPSIIKLVTRYQKHHSRNAGAAAFLTDQDFRPNWVNIYSKCPGQGPIVKLKLQKFANLS